MIVISSAKPTMCAGCGRQLDTGAGSWFAVVGKDTFHIGCTPEAKRKADEFFHSEECPTCRGKGRVPKSAS